MSGPGPAERERPRASVLAAVVEFWVGLPLPPRAAAPVACMAFLWWSSSRTLSPQSPSVVKELLHNGAHIVAYAALAASFWLAWSRTPAATRQPLRSRISWILATGYGAVDELHQASVPGRVGSIADLLSDASGAALAIAALWAMLGLSRAPILPLLASAAACAASVCLATFSGW